MKKKFSISVSCGALAVCALWVLPSAFAQTHRDRITASPTPSASPTPTPPERPTPTLGDLQGGIASRLMSSEAKRARVGVKIVSLKSGKVVFESDAEKYFVPASNMKNFTVAAALEALGPDFKFVMSVYSPTAPDANGTIKGDVRIAGRGDVSFSTLFAAKPANDPDIYYEALDRLADKIIATGVKRIEGSLVADETYFRGNAVPATWEWDDLQWYDGAEVSAFPINNNALDLIVKGGPVGGPCTIALLPQNALYQITNTCTTTSSGTKRALAVKKALDTNKVLISGSMSAGDAFTGYLTFKHPAELFIAMLKERLEKKGVVITGGARMWVPPSAPAPLPPNSSPPQYTIPAEIVRFESPPFSEIIQKTMKPSQNMFTEVILWTLGEEISRKKGGSGDSNQLGLGVVRNFLTTAGVVSDGIVQYDGSGLSRHDLVTPASIVQLYVYMAKQSKNAQAWRNSLTIGGVDGTLRNRFKGTRAEGNMRGKTGTLDQVSALSGYVTTAGGEELVVSIMVNGMLVPSQRTALIDGIVVQLANFTGRVDQ